MIRSRRSSFLPGHIVVLWLAIAVATPSTFAQAEHPVTGRRIAPVMGVSGADWLNRPAGNERRIRNGLSKSCICIPGWWWRRRRGHRLLQPEDRKRVIRPESAANDIQPQMLNKLRANAASRGITNVETVLGTESHPNLPSGQLDLIIMVDVYHELSRPQRMLQQLHAALKPNGQLVLLEFRKEDLSVPIRPEHKMSLEEVKAEVEPEGYRFEKSVETLPWQHMVFFRKASVN